MDHMDTLKLAETESTLWAEAQVVNDQRMPPPIIDMILPSIPGRWCFTDGSWKEGVTFSGQENLPQDGDALGGIDPRADHLRPQRQPQHPPRQARAIGAYDQPHINENNKYHGLAAEDPFDHLYKFDKYCGLSKTNGVSGDPFKLKLFPFSFGDKAHQWEKTLPSDTVTTWEECKRVFLDKLFPTSRTAKIRNEISGKEILLSTFYRGALPQCRNMLDTASNGFFLGRTEEETEELVENMAKSDSVYSEEHDRVNRSDDQQTEKEIKSLQEKMDLLLSNQAKQEQMNFVGGPSQEVPPKVNEYNNYQQRSYSNNQQGGYQPKQNTQQGSYQPRQNIPHGFNNHSNQSTQVQGSSSQAPASDTSVDGMFKKLLDFQAKNEKTMGYEFKNIHSKIDGSYNELNNKIRNSENQFASMNSQPSRQQGSLPGKPEQNPKETMKAITLKSGRELPPRVLTKDDEKVDEEILEKIVEAKGKEKVGEEKKIVKHGETATLTKESSFVPPPFEPKLPFPGRFKRQLLEKYKALFEKQMSEVQVTMPIIDAFMLVPQYSKFLKDDVAAKKKDMEVKIHVGILEDIPLMVGNFEIPTDFVVLEMGEVARDPLILGRPFLATTGAIVNVREGKIDLHLGKGNILHFDINEVMKRPTIQNQIFYIDEMDDLADELLEELALEDHLHHALTIEREVQVIENKESDAYVKVLDSHKGIGGEDQNEELTHEIQHAASATQQEDIHQEDWSELRRLKWNLNLFPKV
ncbi:uncharacterized protein LOC106398032 [Brassica napus]|uniref:uncharacterized protein LOC106398032 n=1 Tax=Brassica napus TaxID=3708 RepID=UPI00207A8715|nr:uncharacterized protein LOC106398032 [Brassica napus]